MKTTIIVCDTCDFSETEKFDAAGQTGGEILAGHVENLASRVPGLAVRRQSCLMGCERHCNTVVAAPGKLTYVIGRFEPCAESAQAVIDYACLHRDSGTGQVPYKQWPHGVKGHFIARIPALDTAPGPAPKIDGD